MLNLFATMQFMAGVVFVGFFFSVGRAGDSFSCESFKFKGFELSKEPKTLEWKCPLNPCSDYSS